LPLLAVFAAAALAATVPVGRAADAPLFDAHIHYSHDAWEMLPPEDAIRVLREAGVGRALVSSSGDEGTRRLVALAPGTIIPSLRPYRKRGELSTWTRDETILPWLEERLATFRYAAIGEFHVYGADADSPVVRGVVALARRHGLVLHAHSDADAVERLFRQDPEARILWAHSGFARPDEVRRMLERYPTLWCDLAFRNDHAAAGKVEPEWRRLLIDFKDRFLLGTDTFTPERWHYVIEHARWSRAWLADLPPDAAAAIGHGNGARLFGSWPGER